MASTEHQAARDIEAAHAARPDMALCLRHARVVAGKSYFGQVKDIVSLARGFGRLTPADYYYYQLYDDARFPDHEKKRFLSERVHEKILAATASPEARALAGNKPAAQARLHEAGLPLPRTRAVYVGKTGASATETTPYNDAPLFQTTDDLANWLRAGALYPCFAKPVGGIASYGVWYLETYEASDDSLVLAGGRHIPLADFVADIAATPMKGYLFEELLAPDPAIAGQCGGRASTVRVVVTIEDGTPHIAHTVWKIPSARNIADNFWRPGNMIAAVEPETGIVTRAIRGHGPEMEDHASHPENGLPLKGLRLPHWRELRDVCLNGARIFSGLAYQSWDMGLAAAGPVIVEVNAGSAFLLPQLAEGRGFLDDRFQAFLLAQRVL